MDKIQQNSPLCADKNDAYAVNNIISNAISQQVEEVRALCKQCGVDDKGSKVDLVMRLSKKMFSRVTYNKVFEKVWGVSGKLDHMIRHKKFHLVIACCGNTIYVQVCSYVG